MVLPGIRAFRVSAAALVAIVTGISALFSSAQVPQPKWRFTPSVLCAPAASRAAKHNSPAPLLASPKPCTRLTVHVNEAERPRSEALLGRPKVGDRIRVAGFHVPVEHQGPLEFLACHENAVLYRWEEGKRGRPMAIAFRQHHTDQAKGPQARRLSPEDLRALRSVALGMWSRDIAGVLKGVDWTQACIELTAGFAMGRSAAHPLPRVQCLFTHTLPLGDALVRRWLLDSRTLRRFQVDDTGGYDGATLDCRHLSRHRQLKHLDLSHLTLTHVAALGGLARLQTLRIDSADLLGGNMSFLSRLFGLQGLVLTNMTFQSLPALKRLSRLRVLDLRSNGIANASFIQEVAQLEKLLLNHNRLKTLPPLRTLPRLQQLDLSHNPLVSLEALADAPALSVVIANGVSARALPRMPMPALRRMDLLGSPVPVSEILRFRRMRPNALVTVTWADLMTHWLGRGDRLHFERLQPARAGLRWNTTKEVRGKTQVRAVLKLLHGQTVNYGCGCQGDRAISVLQGSRFLGRIHIKHGVRAKVILHRGDHDSPHPPSLSILLAEGSRRFLKRSFAGSGK